MQDYYDRRAPIYDASMGFDRAEVRETHRGVCATVAGKLTGLSVLELACGPGFWTETIAGSARAVMATDFNASTLAEARKKNFPPHVRFTRADAYALGEIEGSFDACFFGDWFCHVPHSRWHAFLSGVHAKLNKGGIVIFCDQSPKDGSLTRKKDTEGNNLQTRALPDGTAFTVIKNFPEPDEFRRELGVYAQAGEIEMTAFPECRRYLVAYRFAPR